jgi:nucleotide-binding universal stress UspA family protein
MAAAAHGRHNCSTMLAAKRIIVPVTFAEDSLEAVAVAATLARALGAELILAGIAPLASPEPVVDGVNGTDTIARLAEEQKLVDQIVCERLEELAEGLSGSVRARTLLTWGPVGMSLVAVAREQRADLVVIPMRRHSELAHFFQDHGDRYVLHHSDVPVLVVPTEGRRERTSSG